jgi:glycosyltransferase involved in cell wall biosynthesis
MHIAIDLLIAEKEPGGMLFATRALLNGLAHIDPLNEYSIVTSRPKEYQELATTPNIQIYPVKLRTWSGILIQHQLLLPDILKKLRPDVLHVPAFAAPIGWHGPLVMTIHDLAFLKVPQQSSLYARLYWQYLLRESVRRAQQVIAISGQTVEELHAFWSIEPERIHLIHNALRPSLRRDAVRLQDIQAMQQRYGERYLLHVGRIMPRKNVETLIQAFDLLAARFPDLHLVLTGGAGHGSAGVLQQITDSPYRERIHQAGWIADQDMGALYAAAQALVFPSKHEGFGLPTVEAMACGTPVIASFEAASTEIAGDAVVRTDCSTPTPLANAITEVLTDHELRTRLIRLGLEHATTFSDKICARATLQVYYQAAGLVPPATQSETDHQLTNIRSGE